ncbi:MAG: UPF0175 family protein [Gammaproteobacteria bacterium]|nr:UPF0175 family protein [Gammaproteobacteria bacterium]
MFHTEEFVDAHLYQSEEAVIQDAIRHLLRSRPELRIQLAIYRYRTQDISLAKAASLAGMSWMQMKEVLSERGVQLRLGPETMDEAREEVDALRLELGKRP